MALYAELVLRVALMFMAGWTLFGVLFVDHRPWMARAATAVCAAVTLYIALVVVWYV